MALKNSVVKKAYPPKDKTTSKLSTTSLMVEFENGDKGYYKLIKGVDPPFNVGSPIDYEATKPEGKNYLVITIPEKSETTEKQVETKKDIPPEERKWKGGGSINDMKFEARMHLIELVTRLIIAGRVEPKEAGEYYTTWVSMVDGTIDELKG